MGIGGEPGLLGAGGMPETLEHEEVMGHDVGPSMLLRWVGWVGVPSAIALFLVYMMTMGIAADVKSGKDATVAAVTSVKAASDSLAAHMSQTQTSDRELRRYLSMICYNTAPNEDARRRCVEDSSAR